MREETPAHYKGATMTQTATNTISKVEIKFPDRYNVIIFNDDFTPVDFVIQLLIEIFNKDIELATSATMQIHEKGKAVAGTYSFEVAEQKHAEATSAARSNGYPLKLSLEKM